MALNDRSRILIAVAVIAASIAIIASTAFGYAFDQKIKYIRKMHRDEVSSMRRDFNKQIKRRDDALEILKKIEYEIANKCKG